MAWELRHSFRALRHRNFQLFVPGQFISLIGFWMQSVGLSWLVYRLTHSSSYLGAIAFSQQIPILLFATAAGGFVDRTNRHRLVIAAQALLLVHAGVLSWLTYTNHITIPLLFVLAVVGGTISAFDMPARQAFLVQMVNRDDLMNAIALNSSMFNAARVVGPAIAGFTVAKWGEAFCFFMNAVSYVAVLIPLFFMKIDPYKKREQVSLAKDLIEGFRYVRGARPVLVLLLLIGAFGLAGFSFTVLLPVYADRIFARGAAGLGWLMTATGVGALFGALFLAGRKGMKGMGRLIASSAFAYPVALICFSFSNRFWLSFGILIVVGFFMMVLVAAINTTIQSMISDAFRGRVMSFFTTMLIGVAPIGSFMAGAAADHIGVKWTVFLFSLVCVAAAFWFSRSLPKIVQEARRLIQLQTRPVPQEAIPR